MPFFKGPIRGNLLPSLYTSMRRIHVYATGSVHRCGPVLALKAYPGTGGLLCDWMG